MAARELGRHYTPAALARRMVGESLASLERQRAAFPWRLLDPACGAGVFLLEAFDELCARGDARTPAERLRIARDCLFGVDLDPAAVAVLRQSLLSRIAATGELVAAAERAVEANVRVADALADEAFHPADRFDLVIGNPPYLRERDAQPHFERLSATQLGRRWREARMDLWHYFAHRGLDVLRTGGLLSFVVNSYWTASRGAGNLISRLERETRFEQIDLLGKQKLFPGVSGHHLVFRLRKSEGGAQAGLALVTRSSEACLPSPEGIALGCDDGQSSPPPERFEVPHADLFQGGRMVLSPPARLDDADGNLLLADAFDTRQGMAENPPRINARLLDTDARYTLGEGVFVLTPDETERLQLDERERQLLRPYVELRGIGRYAPPAGPTHFVLYLTRRTAPALDEFPRVAAHLERFRPILERRREVQRGRCAWWRLHWPREESIFTRPRLLALQMGRRPQFAFAERPAFVGFSVNLILSRAPGLCSLPALAGVLNSQLAAEWFERHAKWRGVRLEINAHVLRSFPLPAPDAARDDRLSGLVLRRQALPAESSEASALEAQIEDEVTGWYRLRGSV